MTLDELVIILVGLSIPIGLVAWVYIRFKSNEIKANLALAEFNLIVVGFIILAAVLGAMA